MKYPKICQAEAISDRILRVTFTNQDIKNYDISPLLDRPMFAPPLRQPAFFRNFKVEPGGYAIIWNDAIDLSEYELWKKGIAAKPDTNFDSIPSDERFRVLVEGYGGVGG